MKDEEIRIVRDIKGGKKEAFSEIVYRYQDKIYGLALSMVHNTHDAEDITQKVFFGVFKSIKKFKEDSSFGTWIYRIAINTINKYFRDVKSKEKNIVSLDAPLEGEDVHLEIPDTAPDPLSKLERQELKEQIKKAIDELPEVYRATLLLRIIEGLSYEEISQALNCSIGTVKSRLHNATILVGEKLKSYINGKI